MPDYGPVARQGRPSGGDGTAPTAVGGRQPTYTSFASLGAAQPLSPSGSQSGAASRSRSLVSGFWHALASFAALLDPTEGWHEEGEVLAEENGRRGGPSRPVADESTPLLAQIEAATGSRDGQHRLQPRRSRKYIGGGCICDPFEWNSARGQQAAVAGVTELDHGSCRICTDDGSRIALECGQVYHTSPWPSGMALSALSQLCYASFSMFSGLFGRCITSDDGKRHGPDALQMLVWHSLAMMLVSALVLLSCRRFDLLTGPRRALAWHWARAACAATSATAFVVASQRIAMSSLVTLVYVAPTMYTIGSQLFSASRNPFRAQLAALSLWIGLVLMIAPQMSSSPSGPENDATVAASPLDLPPIAAGTPMAISLRWAYASAVVSSISTFLSFALLHRRPAGRHPGGVSAYNTIFSSSLIICLAAISLQTAFVGSTDVLGPSPFTGSSWKPPLIAAVALLFSLLARVLQEVAVTRTGVCQTALLAFLQPFLSTGLDVIFDNELDIGDVIPLAGCLLIAVNLAWIASPLDDDDADPL